MFIRPWVFLVPLAFVMVVLWPASSARADPARPGNTVSQVEALRPPEPGVTVDIVGGDAFVRVRAKPGVEVSVPGYRGEPYLWIRPDGSVWRNAASPTTEVNETRYLTAASPDLRTDSPDWDRAPDWQSYGSGGEVLWHDHRAHWMGSGLPPTIDPEGLVQRWEIPLIVNGTEVLVTGVLRRVTPATPLWWLVAVVTVGVLAAWRRRVAWLQVASGVVGSLTAVTAWWAWLSLPVPARAAPAVAVLASMAAVLALSARVRAHGVLAAPLLAGAGTALLVVTWLSRTAVTAAVVPGLATPWPWRLMVAAALGAGLMSLLVGVQTASRSRAPVSLEG